MEKHFIDLCIYGKLEEAKQYYFNNPIINIHARDEYAIRCTCAYGKLEVAKWLYLIKPTINISANNEEAFWGACENGHI